jgi:CheY-like chemotaxis protein
LVDNAVKFTAQGEVTILVQKENETDRDLRVRFVVKDTGPGVPRAERAKLFNAFSQLDGSSTRAHDGLGLGLAVAQRLTTLMKGTLDVEGEEGQGGVFVAVLPLDKSDRPLAPVPAPTTGGQPAAPALPRRHYRILIVEDNAVNQKVALLLLEKLGYTAELADNGQQAVAAFENGIFDLILMDCQMPVLDGYQATIEMRKREGQKRHVPILAVTANSSDEDREKCFASGMDEYVTKPLSVDRLSSLLAKWDVSVEPEALNGLKELGVETFPQIRDQFLTQSLEQMDQLGTAVAAGDWKAVHALCHKIKGSSGTFGAVRMQRLCRRGEEAATRENGKDLAFLAEALREEFERVRLFLQ